MFARLPRRHVDIPIMNKRPTDDSAGRLCRVRFCRKPYANAVRGNQSERIFSIVASASLACLKPPACSTN